MWRAPLSGASLIVPAMVGSLLPGLAIAQTLDQVLSDVSAKDGDDCAVVAISLNAPIRLLNALLPGNAAELQIRMAPVAGSEISSFGGVSESLRAPSSANVMVRKIEFDGDAPQGPTLTVAFDHAMNYEVTQGDDFRSVLITVWAHARKAQCHPGSARPRPDRAPRLAASATPAEMGLPPASPSLAGAEDQLSPADHAAMSEARASVTSGDYGHAVDVLIRLLEHLTGPGRAPARELLGIAREKNGQLAHAMEEYQAFLVMVPDGPDAERVRQRLAALIFKTTPRNVERGTAITTFKHGQTETWSLHGSVSAYYMFDKSEQKFLDLTNLTSTTQTNTNLDQLLTNGDVTASYSSPIVNLKFRATGSYTDNFKPQQGFASTFMSI